MKPTSQNPSPAYVALLRGINVGGHKRISMEDLRELFRAAGCSQVTTYIQSGNVLFTSSAEPAELASDLERRVEAATGYEVTVILRSEAELAKIVADNPFASAGVDFAELHLMLLLDRPPGEAITKIDPAQFAPEEFVLQDREVYLRLPNGMGRAKLSPSLFERVLKTPGTARNWKTVTKLLALAEQMAREPTTGASLA